MAREPINGYQSSLMDNNVPSQIDEDVLKAEMEIEIPDSQNDVMAMIDADGVDEIEISETEDGGVEVDFDPQDQRGEDDDFYANLAEEMPDRELQRIAGELLGEYDANKASRQDWEDAYSSGLELLGFNYEERAQPFRGSSGVTHPLLAEAATQFQAQAFNELLPASGSWRITLLTWIRCCSICRLLGLLSRKHIMMRLWVVRSVSLYRQRTWLFPMRPRTSKHALISHKL
jgi:hypothetical protein